MRCHADQLALDEKTIKEMCVREGKNMWKTWNVFTFFFSLITRFYGHNFFRHHTHSIHRSIKEVVVTKKRVIVLAKGILIFFFEWQLLLNSKVSNSGSLCGCDESINREREKSHFAVRPKFRIKIFSRTSANGIFVRVWEELMNEGEREE